MKIRNQKVDDTIHATRSKMDHLVLAYKEAPWRTQRKWIGLFLVGTIAVGMVAGIYLNVTSRAALAGREIQDLEAAISDTQRNNADLETELAELLSTGNLLARAEEMGFVPASPEDVVFMTIPGYFPPASELVMSSSNVSRHSPALDPRFSQSLFGWFEDQMQKAATR
jgi:cell division protein FtsL